MAVIVKNKNIPNTCSDCEFKEALADCCLTNADYKPFDCPLEDFSSEPEPLTDKEKRIFLAAMGREMKVCEEVDSNYTREPYEDSLVKVCREIERKVKGALWMT